MPDSRVPSSSPSVEAMVTAAANDRDALDGLRAAFQARIARRSDDFEATRGLQLAERALNQLSPQADDPWDKAVRKLVKD